MDYLTSILLGILTSLIASIIFFFTSGYIKRKSNQLFEWYLARNKKFSDKYYTSISKNSKNNFEFVIAILILFLIYYSAIDGVLEFNDHYKIHSELIKEIKNVKNIDYIKYKNLFDDLEKKQKFENSQFVRENFWIYSIMRYFLWVIVIVGTLLLALRIIRGNQMREINREFTRYLDILSPFISTNEILILKSQWAMMHSRENFLEIWEEIENHRKSISKRKE